jgi:hypothetical protein
MNAEEQPKLPKRRYSKHGLTRLKRAVTGVNAHVIDRRTSLGKALAQWRADLVEDLGGQEAVSTQQLALIDLAARSKLLLDSIDAWLLVQPSLVDKRKRALLSVIQQRKGLADSLALYLDKLGLKRQARPAKSLAEYMTEKYGGQQPVRPDDSSTGLDAEYRRASSNGKTLPPRGIEASPKSDHSLNLNSEGALSGNRSPNPPEDIPDKERSDAS